LSTAANITVPETLALLDGRFSPFAEGIAEDRYALWLGSAISLERLPGLKQLIEKVLEHLRSHINPLDADCKYKAALENALVLAGITPAERTACDFRIPFARWPHADPLASRLINQYSRLLQIEVRGEEDDYPSPECGGMRVQSCAVDKSQPSVARISLSKRWRLDRE
jgi:hypothetical protein